MSRASEWTLALCAFLFVSLIYASTQPVANTSEDLGSAGRVYYGMAKAMPRHLPPVGDAPEVYRIGLPLAVAAVAKSLDWVIAAGFDRLNLAFGAISLIGFTVLLQRHVPSAFARLVVVGAFLLEPHSPIRLAYFTPVFLNSATLAFLIAGLLAVDWYAASPSARRTVLLAILVAVGVSVHEVVIVIGFCAVFGPKRPTALPLVAGLMSLAALCAWIVPTHPGLPFGDMLWWLNAKSLPHYLLSWGFVFGPLLAIALYFWRRSTAFLATESGLLTYVALLAVYAWIGGPETEELLAYASPVVWILIARGISLSGLSTWSLRTMAVLAVQAIASRAFITIGGPLDTPVYNGETWERLGWAGFKTALSYANMRTQFGSQSVMEWYYLLYVLAGVAVIALVSQHGEASGALDCLAASDARFRSSEPVAKPARRAQKPIAPAVLFGVALPVALAPVVWLSVSRFYGSHFETPGVSYFFYNLARVWTGIVLFAVFWATGTRIIRVKPDRLTWTSHIEGIVAGAAAWSLAIVLLATLHLFYQWLVLSAVAIGFGLALHDLTRNTPDIAAPTAPTNGWALLARVAAGTCAIALLVAVALWGDTVGDYDVFGTYLAYYQAVLDSHSNGPNPYYVHYWITKGHGVGFLFNILSDVQAAAIASYGFILLGGAMVWRLAVRPASAASGSVIGWVGVCVYLAFYMHGGAMAKPHTIRNTLILYLALSFAAHIALPDSAAQLYRWSRLLVITAILLLTPMSIAIILPMCFAEIVLIGHLRGTADAIRMLLYPAWALGATLSIWLSNYFTVGLPEAPLVMQGHFMNVDRFERWLDPAIAYLKFGGTPEVAEGAVGLQAGEVLVRVFNPTAFFADFLARLGQIFVESTGNAALVLAAGGLVAAILTRVVMRRRSDNAVPARPQLLAPVAYLVFIVAILISFRMLGGGSSGSSTARFTDFIDPVLIAIGVLLLSSAWLESEDTSARHWVRLLIGGSCVAASVIALQVVFQSPWAIGLNFLVGAQSYASMHEPSWRMATAARVAGTIPGVSPIELVTDVPAFTGLPSTRFQVPDGSVYGREFRRVVFGTAEQAEAIYRKSGIEYFLFDVADGSAVFWPGFGSLFEAGSVRSHLKVFAHLPTEANDFYVLTWKTDVEPQTLEEEQFAQKWLAKVERERKVGYYGPYLRNYSR